MSRERGHLPGAAFVIAAAIHRVQADLETIEEAERHAADRMLDAPAAVEERDSRGTRRAAS